jgi:RNA polymerase sigma factor (sigma-70 family)
MDQDAKWLTRYTLLQRIRNQNDEKSWEEFVAKYRQYIYNIARRSGLCHHDAEEIVQRVSVKLWQKLPDFEYDPSKGRFRGWLCTVTRNETWKLLSRNSPADRPEAGTQGTDAAESQPAAQPPELERIAEEEWRAYVAGLAWQRVRECFDARVTEVFELLSKGGRPEEVAHRLAMPVGTVYVYKKRVVDRLRGEIMRLNAELD